MHPLALFKCRTHAACFTIYPHGYLKYARVALFARATDEVPGESLIGGAIAIVDGRRPPDELIEDERGPVRRTAERRAQKVAAVLGLDGQEVSSEVLAVLSLPGVSMRHEGPARRRINHRVAALAPLSMMPRGFLRALAAISVVGTYDGVGLIEGVRIGTVIGAASPVARALRGPPQTQRMTAPSPDFVLEMMGPNS
jgi:hypothetical protein